VPKKKKNKTKKKARTRTRAKAKSTPRKAPAKRRLAKPVGVLAASAVRGLVGAIADDPLGACYWVDTTGANHCKVTTQSACKAIPGSLFRPNKQCAGG
jgi:hypothetical protein